MMINLFFVANLELTMGYSRKSPRRGGGGGPAGEGEGLIEDIFCCKNRGMFRFVSLSSEIPDKTKLRPWKNSTKLCYTPGTSKALKTKTSLITPENASSFLRPLEFWHYIFSIYPQEISCPQPFLLFGIFSGIAQLQLPY